MRADVFYIVLCCFILFLFEFSLSFFMKVVERIIQKWVKDYTSIDPR